jgi:uncharacterized SAM-binding protein YcdF (DUF218 family)
MEPESANSTQKQVLLVLGSPNSQIGELSEIAVGRLQLCFEVFSREKNCRILCTGGWGSQFNETEKPHAWYAKDYLISKGVDEGHFLEFALSSNTVEDALKTKEILRNMAVDKLTIISTDYHLERVKMIFDEILSFYDMEYRGAPNNFKNHNLEKLISHERKAIKAILEKGLSF